MITKILKDERPPASHNGRRTPVPLDVTVRKQIDRAVSRISFDTEQPQSRAPMRPIASTA